MVFTTVPLADFQLVQGADRLGRFASTSFGERSFCRDCGSPLTMHVRHQPDEIDIAVGSLDKADAFSPNFHLYVAEAPAWAVFKDRLPQFQALRPNTRGLRPGQVSA